MADVSLIYVGIRVLEAREFTYWDRGRPRPQMSAANIRCNGIHLIEARQAPSVLNCTSDH